MKLTPEGIREAFKIIEAPDIYSAHIVNGAQETMDAAALRLADVMEELNHRPYKIPLTSYDHTRKRILDLINGETKGN